MVEYRREAFRYMTHRPIDIHVTTAGYLIFLGGGVRHIKGREAVLIKDLHCFPYQIVFASDQSGMPAYLCLLSTAGLNLVTRSLYSGWSLMKRETDAQFTITCAFAFRWSSKTC